MWMIHDNFLFTDKITRAILAVISLFVVCWLPNHVITILHAVNVKNSEASFKRNLAVSLLSWSFEFYGAFNLELTKAI